MYVPDQRLWSVQMTFVTFIGYLGLCGIHIYMYLYCTNFQRLINEVFEGGRGEGGFSQ